MIDLLTDEGESTAFSTIYGQLGLALGGGGFGVDLASFLGLAGHGNRLPECQ